MLTAADVEPLVRARLVRLGRRVPAADVAWVLARSLPRVLRQWAADYPLPPSLTQTERRETWRSWAPHVAAVLAEDAAAL